MKNRYNRVLLIVFFTLFGMHSYAQEVTVLPYEMIGEKMIVKMLINGELTPMVFDTGGKNLIKVKLKEKLGLSTINSKEVIDVSGQKQHVDIVQVNSIETPDHKTSFQKVPVLVLDNELFECEDGPQGLIGSDLWQNSTIEIDDKAKVIKIRSGGLASLKNNPQALPFIDNGQGSPIFEIKIGRFDKARVLFDSGAAGFLTLKVPEYPRLEGLGALYMIRQGEASGSLGVLGRGANGNRYLLEAREIFIGQGSFSKFRFGVTNSTESLLGYQLLTYGNITIDYVNKLFLFEPFTTEKVKGAQTFWELEMGPADDKMIVTTVWEKLKGEVAVGDEITHINGKKIIPLSFCENLKGGYPILEESERLVLTIKTKDGIKEIEVVKD
ncbi:retropepsin-like domain-containing protein [Sphingobacterium sp. SRCM116780]|uniref:retropepsin-like aspartic protease n=1 Tax=Sphingobacterium sp. SRCM116780 TaxID=2907623 RepID=UPI001F444B5D|nr:retropepsin-like aspartic protease [Sphingobacterium sp. SRCM116780]UIR54893.1 retropepsin-like domain-containing protein [Sphingobacterium sp. SRCM116780]